MRCLTDSEFGEWLGRFGARPTNEGNLIFTNGSQEHVLMAGLPRTAGTLYFFAGWLARRLPTGRGRLLWLRHWMTYPPDQHVAFESLRRGLGEGRLIGAAPAHLFAPSTTQQFDNRTSSDVSEDAALMSLVLMVILFDWKAYLLADGCSDYVYLADEHVAFAASDRAELEVLKRELVGLDCEVNWIKHA